MSNSQSNLESGHEMLLHNPMAMAEFLENDIEGYEYVKGELVPMAAAASVHKKLKLILFYCKIVID